MSYVPIRRGYRGRGFGNYDATGNWTWEYYPPPYDFLGPKDPAVIPVPVLYASDFGSGLSGVGCGCGGSCGGCGGGDHSHGMGLFDTWDVSQWGLGEYAAAGVGVYLLAKLLGDISRGAGRVRKASRRKQSVARRRQDLQRQLAEL